ncbi:3-deoxy-D-manno-octulosonic acid transferase [hydrothermal vent metagenome]|uniref:3-deoxy-D-manno-octulosonic acid transferase n=1 Tax=hydrothermal vent metagenome TaxID=652676 RepID=A0A3B0Y9L7_9ZZZZ
MGYFFLSIVLWPIFFLYTGRIALRDKSLRYFLQRLGQAYPRQSERHIWIHCASVGEVNTLMPLLHKLLEQFPQSQFVITTTTTTGAQTLARHNPERTQHCYLPVESFFSINRFLYAWQVQQCLIMETEIWPLLYRCCARQHIDITLINARLSHRTLNTHQWVKKLYRESLKKVSKILCKSAQEVNHFKSLGATDKQLFMCGNLKFTSTENTHDLLQPINLNNRNYCVAASTHDNEEQQLAQLWCKRHAGHPQKPEAQPGPQKPASHELLVIVPRHPQRSEKIQKQLKRLNMSYAVRSKHQPINTTTLIYLADTLGELAGFIAAADIVFIGGSLIEHGGQNILEAARAGKAIICGPHMFNFKDEVELLLAHQACIQVKDINVLAHTFSDLLEHPEQRKILGENARAALEQQDDILEKYVSQLDKLV